MANRTNPMQATFITKSTGAMHSRLNGKADAGGRRRGMSGTLPGALAIAMILGAGLPATARAAIVSGTLTGYEGKAEPSRDLHFENCVTHDEYLAPTHNDSSFAQNLPPGCYD